MRRLVGYFLRGLVFLVPVAVTAYILVLIFRTIDGWLGLSIPGLGFLVTVFLITFVGFAGSTFLARSFLAMFDRMLERLPFVRFLYTSTKDLVNAFVGEKRRFDQPVAVRLVPDGEIRALGFVTQKSLARLGMDDFVAVYFPQSYNFAGSLLLCPGRDVERIPASSSDVMAFIVSGGVTDVPQLHAGTPPRGVQAT
ncbi:MAG TPA: DUF502 domain-containing protein [Gemmatimonadaceae bacterium]|nr:DUF502 domain-containing protein [Gemmatimonadaceae bacterium]